VQFSNGEEDLDFDDDFQKILPPSKTEINYMTKLAWSFQIEWAAKLVRVEII